MKVEGMGDYFLFSLSNSENLELCLRYALAGFPNTRNGLWAYLDVEEGDYVSFLFGAKIYNLYRVRRKYAIREFRECGPWPPICFASGRRYYFPFRVELSPLRRFEESLIRPEFSYIAEDLLLRGGYRKTHLQADSITLHIVSSIGERMVEETYETLQHSSETYEPTIILSNEKRENIPYSFALNELILQTLFRRRLKEDRELLGDLLEALRLEREPEGYEVLGEKAVPGGHIDLLIKRRYPIEEATKVTVEVKKGRVGWRDFEQLKKYMEELGGECRGGVLLGRSFARNLRIGNNIVLVRYDIDINREEVEYTELYENTVFYIF